jgi:basic amino acid/polyamine antiporter, APA family
MVNPAASRSLLRVFGLGFAVAVVIGGAVGQGILRTPGLVARELGNVELILIAWAVGGLVAIVDAMSTAELASSVPVAGGPYAFVRRAFGDFTGLVAGWCDWVSGTASTAFIAIVFAECLHHVGVLAGISLGGIAVGLLVALGLLHFAGARIGGASQSVGNALKGLALLMLACALLLAPSVEAAPLEQVPPGVTLLGAIAAMRAIYGTYGGWNAAAYFGEEVRQPERNLARALFSGIAIITVLYLLLNAALLHVLTIPELAASNLPVADAAARTFGLRGAIVVAIVAALAVATVANAQVMYVPRILFSMARDGLVFERIARVSRSGTPTGATGLTLVLTITLAATGVYETLLAIYASLATLVAALVNAAAIRMRLRATSVPRGYRMPLFPIPAVVALLINISLGAAFFFENPKSGGYALLLLAGVLPVYWVVTRFRPTRVMTERDVDRPY